MTLSRQLRIGDLVTIARCNKRLEEQLAATDDLGASSQEIEAALGADLCAADASRG